MTHSAISDAAPIPFDFDAEASLARMEGLTAGSPFGERSFSRWTRAMRKALLRGGRLPSKGRVAALFPDSTVGHELEALDLVAAWLRHADWHSRGPRLLPATRDAYEVAIRLVRTTRVVPLESDLD